MNNAAEHLNILSKNEKNKSNCKTDRTCDADTSVKAGLMALLGTVVCLHAAPRVQLIVNGHIMCCRTISSCQSAATSKIVKRYSSLVSRHS